VIPTFIRAYAATSVILGSRIVAFATPAASQGITHATGPEDPLFGVSDRMGAPEGGMCDVHRGGLVSVELGGTVAAGDPLTSDATGRAVKAEAAGGETIRIVGWADEPGVEGDIVDAFLAVSLLHEPA